MVQQAATAVIDGALLEIAAAQYWGTFGYRPPICGLYWAVSSNMTVEATSALDWRWFRHRSPAAICHLVR